MSKKGSTIENRVYIFDTLAEALLNSGGAELLASPKDSERARAMKALADLAYVSCVVSDTSDLDAAEVRDAVLAGLAGPDAEGSPAVPPVPSGSAKPKKRRRGKGDKRS
ncbi:MAG: hypothetical protein RID81_14905 [Sandaracinaceae bacterium]|nr:MAG: hypothetical protein EVA89_14090 [Sandaracinaceae bacterium]HBQ19798.1 hypothetical protein [Myxococcales bacterium]